MAHHNIELVRDGYAAFARRDLAVLQNKFFAPDITWHYAGQSQLGGRYQGIDQVLCWLCRSVALSDGTLSIELHDVVGNDNHVIAIAIIRAKRNGRQLYDQSVQSFHLAQGKATEVWTLPGNQYYSDEFWS
jgi:ketosteroid isomerase-like protein